MHLPNPLVLVSSLFISFSVVCGAEWTLVDDFETTFDGKPVTTDSKWTQAPGFESAVVHMLEDGNRVARIGPGQALFSRNVPGSIGVPDGSTGVIYLKFRCLKDSRYSGGYFGIQSNALADPSQIDAGWSLGDPADGSRPNATLSILQKEDDITLVRSRGRMNKAYENAPEIKPGIWHSLWVTIDNSRDEVRMFIQGGDFESRTELTHFRNAQQDVFPFQTEGALELRHFIVANPTDANEHNPRSIEIDEINFMLQTPPGALASGARR